MKIYLFAGIDVHTTNYTLCVSTCLEGGGSKEVYKPKNLSPRVVEVTRVLDTLVAQFSANGDDVYVTVGYEAGCLGFAPQREFLAAGYDCIVIAPKKWGEIKNDKRDSRAISNALANKDYKLVYPPLPEDEQARDIIRERNSALDDVKRIKQRIHAHVLKWGYKYSSGSYWTIKHRNWLKELHLQDMGVLDGMLYNLGRAEEYLDLCNKRIEEVAKSERYAALVKKLCCLAGVKTLTALTFITEIGDITRFQNPGRLCGYCGLNPGEHSSGDHVVRTGITKRGNEHLRKAAVESAEAICRGSVGAKSKELAARQRGNPLDVIAYADRANVRLRKKYYRMIHAGKNRNVAVTAVARELVAFIWGIMTGDMSTREEKRQAAAMLQAG